MDDSIIKYGYRWPAGMDALTIEIQCIRWRGQWTSKSTGKTFGRGLPFHYRELQKLIWPMYDHHRWSDLVLENICANSITAVLGPKSSGKTHDAAKFALTDYFVFPHCTGILVSSTTLDALDRRIWGEIVHLFKLAKERFPQLPGNLVNFKRIIVTDDLEEDGTRDVRNGIIAVACKMANTFVGLSNYVGFKNQRVRLMADECFPAGTMVDTPKGPTDIKKLKAGDSVMSAFGVDTVLAVGIKNCTRLVKIKTTDGREIICTENHPIFTNEGKRKAVDINRGEYIFSINEAMRILRGNVPAVIKQPGVCSVPEKTPVSNLPQLRSQVSERTPEIAEKMLRETMRGAMAIIPARIPEKVLHQGTRKKDFHGKIQNAPGQAGTGGTTAQTTVGEQLHEKSGFRSENDVESPNENTEIPRQNGRSHQSKMAARRIHHGPVKKDSARSDHVRTLSRSNLESSGSDRGKAQAGVSIPLSGGLGFYGYKIGCGSGRRFAPTLQNKGTGCEKNKVPDGGWVESREVLEQGDFERLSGGKKEIEVYNLHVEKHHTYSVNGLTVFNCQFMGDGFLNAVANLDSNPDFKAVFMGNPLDPTDQLGRASEPEEGWSSLPEPTKTTVWKTRFMNGVAINLVGTDSPNFDYDQNLPPRYKYLIDQRRIDNVAKFWGKDSHQYYSQCIGIMKQGLTARRVITRQICIQHGAFEPVIWGPGKHQKIYGIDAAYSGTEGDRCVAGWIELGFNLQGLPTIKVYPPKIIPVNLTETSSPEDQIALYVQQDIAEQGIPADAVYYDATGRGSLGAAFARVFGSLTPVPIEFGGRPNQRPVRYDLFTHDEQKKEKRLVTAWEYYSKMVTQLWFQVRYIIESGQMRELPEDVAFEGYQREWKMVAGNKTEIETKTDMKERTGKSPDLFDWLSTCVEGAIQKGFKIQKLGSELVETGDIDWVSELGQRHRELWKKKQLNYK